MSKIFFKNSSTSGLSAIIILALTKLGQTILTALLNNGNFKYTKPKLKLKLNQAVTDFQDVQNE